MQENLRLIRVFIGSPGGLEEERRAAHDVVKEINQHNSDHWLSIFKLMGWEEAIPGFTRAQDKINQDLDRCDYFIGVMWDKWGSTPSKNPEGYTSGFEEEFCRSVGRIECGLMKDMALFFKKIQVPTGMKPGDEIEKVLNFRQTCIDEKRIFFQDFLEVDSFKDAIRAKLMEIGWREFSDQRHLQKVVPDEDQPPLKEQGSERSSGEASWLVDEEAKEFLSEILHRSADWDATEPREVARLRLIAASVSRSGNDDTHLGTHDANLVFRHYRDAVLSEKEFTALIDCGAAGFSYQNVPLWRWVARADMGRDYLYRLRVLATLGSSAEQVGAIKILQRLGSSLPTHDSYFNKEGVLRDWLSPSLDTNVLDAAVSFMGTNCSEEDIPLIEEASAELPLYKKIKAETAIVEIVLRRSPEEALKRVCERDISNVSNDLTSKLLANPQSLTTDTLRECLAAKSDGIRTSAAKILYEREEIDIQKANELLTDDNVELRLIAAETLHRAGKELEDDILEKALKINKPKTFGLFGSLGGTDATQLETYRTNRLEELPPSELVKLAEHDALQYKCLATYFKLHPRKAVSRIREGLKDSFSNHFEISTTRVREKFASDQKSLELIDKVIPSFQATLVNEGTKALCSLKKPDDLNLVRIVLDSMDIEAHEKIFKFFARFGEWQDISRVLDLGMKTEESANALAIRSVSFADERAAVLLSIGKKRVVDLLSLNLDMTVRAHLLKKIPNSVFASLSADVILRELAHESTECRAIAALRCVQALPKSRVESLLESYIDHADYRYYNSLHWLDLGASLPVDLSKAVASRELVTR